MLRENTQAVIDMLVAGTITGVSNEPTVNSSTLLDAPTVTFAPAIEPPLSITDGRPVQPPRPPQRAVEPPPVPMVDVGHPPQHKPPSAIDTEPQLPTKPGVIGNNDTDHIRTQFRCARQYRCDLAWFRIAL